MNRLPRSLPAILLLWTLVSGTSFAGINRWTTNLSGIAPASIDFDPMTVTDSISGATRIYRDDRSDRDRLCGGADTRAFRN